MARKAREVMCLVLSVQVSPMTAALIANRHKNAKHILVGTVEILAK